jgi:hypothetical protein
MLRGRMKQAKATSQPRGEKEGGIPHRPATQILIKIRREKVAARNRGKMMKGEKIKLTNPVHPALEKNGTRLIPRPRKC